MKKLITCLFLTLMANFTFCQEKLDSLHQVISSELGSKVSTIQNQIDSYKEVNQEISEQNKELKQQINDISRQLPEFKDQLRKEMKSQMGTLSRSLNTHKAKLAILKDSINTLRGQLDSNLVNTNSHLNQIDNGLSTTKNELETVKAIGEKSDKATHEYLTYLLAAICAVLLLVIVAYWLTHREHGNVKNELGDAKLQLQEQISTANADFAEKLAVTLRDLSKNDTGSASAGSPADNKGLILDFAQQIASMENNIWHLPEKDRVRKRIEKATKKMRDSFKSLGYEMPQLMGTEVSDNQIIEIKNRAEDSTIPIGKVIICRVAKPLVLFEGKPISGQRPIVDVKENTEN